jgi:sarcosine oxidase
MQKRASELGAELCLDEGVTSWENKAGEVVVRTSRREVRARALVITAGPWATQILRNLGLPIRIVRKTFVWFNPLMPAEFGEDAIPIFGFPTNSFYGFPNIRNEGVKVAEHWGGEEIARPEEVQPAGEEGYPSILETAARFLPGLAGQPGNAARIMASSTCLYSMTPDEHFILDVHPEQSNVVFAAGFSGHGFKFAPVIGEVMADLALDGQTQVPIGFLRWNEARRRGHE